MEILCLSVTDSRLLAARFAEHGNSHRRMVSALREAGADAALARLRALRRLELRYTIDLGSLSFRFEHRDRPATHPLVRMVLNYIACRGRGATGQSELWILLDRVREVRSLIEQGQLVRERES